MEKQIWKYTISPKESLAMPKGAEVLTVQTQNGDICLWALVDPQNKLEERYFEVYGTGHDIYCDMGIERKYIGTVQLNNGLVFHVFERIS